MYVPALTRSMGWDGMGVVILGMMEGKKDTLQEGEYAGTKKKHSHEAGEKENAKERRSVRTRKIQMLNHIS